MISRALAYLRTHKLALTTACIYPLVILIVNVWIAKKMFGVEYSAYLESNEGTFIAIIREIATGHGDVLWWPIWDLGLPFQNTYLPGLGLIGGVFSALTGHSPALSFHQVCAAFFCLGPAFVYFMAWRMSAMPHASFLGAMAYSILSPCNWLVPAIRADVGGAWNLRRLQIVAYYGEGPHTTMLGFLPLAILFLYLAGGRRKLWIYIVAGIAVAATVLANAFGAVILFMAAVGLIVTSPAGERVRTAVTIACVAIAAYVWISPLLPPTVAAEISRNSPVVTGPATGGNYQFNRVSALGLGGLVLGFALLYWATRKSRPFLRFVLLFAWQATAVVLLGQIFECYVVPQPHRYQIAADLGLCLSMVFGGAAVARRYAPRIIPVAFAVLLVAGAVQARHAIRYGRGLIRSTDITSTDVYRIARWMDQNMSGRRVMTSGAYSFWFNDFTDVAQMHGGHDPMQPDFITLIATYTIYSGMNTGTHDAEYSILWMRALGVRAIHVPGEGSKEYYKPFVNPRKFEGLLPVLWRKGGDTIYGVPVRSDSLAHVVPAAALVEHRPVNGLDVAQLERYVRALEDPSMPEASFEWRNWHKARIHARVTDGQAISVQVRDAPGWRATMDGQKLPIGKDGLGFIVLKPAREGVHDIALVYDGGTEWRATCAASVLLMVGVVWVGVARRRRMRRG